eukprot:CAMPEP_0178427326 /NCGR_PEP_ID=MMETSP0689_2-20121128/29689_1 /TAXON_ID=160604 /ORGANISM="Amphidinium massartii, Strain CS-259" /LENGTH=127 /DNA_ID=CAMNT_0020049033 /DNA_START=46 /DNA_END=430 /DNA_ORIENTATION=-
MANLNDAPTSTEEVEHARKTLRTPTRASEASTVPAEEYEDTLPPLPKDLSRRRNSPGRELDEEYATMSQESYEIGTFPSRKSGDPNSQARQALSSPRSLQLPHNQAAAAGAAIRWLVASRVLRMCRV